MVSLTNFANFSKRATLISVLGLVTLVILIVIFMFGKSLTSSLFPPAPLPASVAFGKLPVVDLTDGVRLAAPLTYKIETVSGDLPKLPETAKVFAIAGASTSFGKLEDVKAKAKNIGFTQDPQIIPGGFKFIDAKDSSRTLTIDSSSGNFVLQAGLQNVSRPNSQSEAVASAREFFNRFNLNNMEFPEDKVGIDNLKISSSGFSPASSLSTTDLMKVNFFKADLDKLPVLPLVDGDSQVWAQVVKDNVLAAKMNIYNLQRFKFATYPLKGIQKAYEQLQNGKAVFNKNPDGDTFVVADVVLGYVESSKTSDFLEPFYIFSTDGSTKAFVPAVLDGWVSTN